MTLKEERKLNKLREQLASLEKEMIAALQKKTSTAPEINIPAYTRKLQELKHQISQFK